MGSIKQANECQALSPAKSKKDLAGLTLTPWESTPIFNP